MLRAPQTNDASDLQTTIVGGKGIDLTGTLGCQHFDCIKGELDMLFRHVWHYFDSIIVPDQAAQALWSFERHKRFDILTDSLGRIVQLLAYLDGLGATDLISFKPRRPGCLQHFREHAREAQIEQALSNFNQVLDDLLNSATVEWRSETSEGHRHLAYRVDAPLLEHSRWGFLCPRENDSPESDPDVRKEIIENVVDSFAAELCADALAARKAGTALGATIRMYKSLLATQPSPQLQDVAFCMNLPVANGLSAADLIRLRQDEKPAFQRFQHALREAITIRLANAEDAKPAEIAAQIQADVIDPELRRIRDLLAASISFSAKSAAIGVGLGAAMTTIGLLSPLRADTVGVGGLVLGGAVTTAGQAIKKSADDYLASIRDVSLSDMYFLWEANQHAIPHHGDGKT